MSLWALLYFVNSIQSFLKGKRSFEQNLPHVNLCFQMEKNITALNDGDCKTALVLYSVTLVLATLKVVAHSLAKLVMTTLEQ